MMNIADRVELRIKRSKRDVFIREDFDDLGGYDQVGRALRQMCTKGLLLKLGYGVYAKARRNRISGRLMVASPGGPDAVLLAALDRLKVPYELSGLTAAYAEGKSTQVPALMEVKVKPEKRFSRKLKIGNREFNAA
ncbi:TPA: S-adenosylhomocysteine hydrolase [Aeromonas veronii]|nr:S-adenosylhomocysteine hydrolase [Aeromonas veronii]